MTRVFLLVKKLSIQGELILFKHVGSVIRTQSSSSTINSGYVGIASGLISTWATCLQKINFINDVNS